MSEGRGVFLYFSDNTRTPHVSDTRTGTGIADRMQQFLSQAFHVAEQFTGMKGKYVKLADTVRSFKEILEGKHDAIPEQAFYMVGNIDEVIAKAKTL